MPYPSEILYASKRAAYNVLLEFGGNEDSDDPLDSLDGLFEDNNAEIQLQILQRCFTASGSRFSKIVQKTVGDTEAQILAIAKNDPSAGRRRLEEIGRELESREKDGTLHESSVGRDGHILENEDTDADTAELAKIMQQMRKKATLTKADMRTLVDAWKKSGSWPSSNEHKMGLHIKVDLNFRNIRWNGGEYRPSFFTTGRIPMAIGDISYLRTPGGVAIENLFREQGNGNAGADRAVSNLIGLAVDLYKPTNDEEFAAALSKFLPTTEIYPGVRPYIER